MSNTTTPAEKLLRRLLSNGPDLLQDCLTNMTLEFLVSNEGLDQEYKQDILLMHNAFSTLLKEAQNLTIQPCK